MCENCYDNAGSPAIINEKTRHCAELIEAIYDSTDGGAGGYAHIVVDDWNLEDENVQFCLDEAVKGKYNLCEETQMACIACMRYMLDMSENERHSAMAIRQGILKVK